MVGPIAPPTVVVVPQPINVAPVVNQPIGAPVVANHIAPAVAANNVAKEWSREDKLLAGIIGVELVEAVIGCGCTTGAAVGAVTITAQMGASDAVITAAGAGTACVGILCVVGSIFGTLACYPRS
ncbi:MAG: hypothetical protein OXF02_01225 [Simkaniaceae bacterium]|nr:hypothetical protein [Simkaniaceae bacterium]